MEPATDEERSIKEDSDEDDSIGDSACSDTPTFRIEDDSACSDTPTFRIEEPSSEQFEEKEHEEMDGGPAFARKVQGQ